MNSKGNVYARKHVANLLGLTERRVSQLTNDGVLTEHSPGYYRLRSAVQDYIAYLRPSQDGMAGMTSLTDEKQRFAKIKRENAEIDLQQKKNELHLSSDVEFIMTNMLIAFKAKLEVLPFKVLPSVVNVPDGDNKANAITGILKSAVEEALDELSKYDPGMFDEESYLAGLDDTVAEEVP